MPEKLIKELGSIVGSKNVLHRLVDLQTYEYDAYLERSLPLAVVFVESTSQVSAVISLLAGKGIPFVPRGGGTNISGGAIPLHGAVVLEMGRMNRILEIDLPNQRMLVQPGIFNLDISTALSPLGFYYAPDPASQKACTLGGNIAENAGGPHCFKYGVTSNHVLGIEVVLPSGEVVWLGDKCADVPGLDLTGSFVGSEGTLGVATAAVVRILRKPEAVKTLLAVCGSIEQGGEVVSAIVAAGLLPATLEMMDKTTINAVEDGMACGFPRDAAAVLLIELDGLQDGLEEMAEQIVSLCLANGVCDVRVAKDENERVALWKGRKGAFGAISRLAPNYLVADGTVPRTRLPEALKRVAEIGRRYDLQVASVFHAGDGNLHPLLLFDSRLEQDRERVMAAGMEVLEVCVELGGTVSGEHGIGVEKLGAMRLVFSDDDLRAQGFIKQAFDPRGLCNPGKVLPVAVAARAGGPAGPEAAGPPLAETPGAAPDLAQRLATILGEQRVTIAPGKAVQGIPAPVEARPVDEAQVSAVLREASRQGLRVCIAGNGTKSEWGNPPLGLDLLVSTLGLRGRPEVDAGNLSLTVTAGTPVAEVRALAEAAGRCLPLDPSRPALATVGGVTATAEQGARGAAYGGVRDVVLGLRAVLADGSPVRFGGRTMKNVTGYDATRLFVGSFGVLGVITEITFRLLPRPDEERLVVVSLDSPAQAQSLVADILASHLQPLALEVLSADYARPALAAAGVDTAPRPVLLAAFSGHRAAVARSLAEIGRRASVTGLPVLADLEAGPVLDALAEAPGALAAGPGPAVAFRATVPMTQLWPLAAALEAAAQMGVAVRYRLGAARGSMDAYLARGPETPPEKLGQLVSGLRERAVSAGGHLLVTQGLSMLPGGFDAWGPPASPLSLMREIKARFDPLGVLNPGRFVGGI